MKKIIIGIVLTLFVVSLLPASALAEDNIRASRRDVVDTTNKNIGPAPVAAMPAVIRHELKVRNITLQTQLNVTEEQLRKRMAFNVMLSNGKKAPVKIMPETASERAIERLRLRVCNATNNCTIELKEVGKGNQTRPAYEVRARKRVRILGIFEVEMGVSADIDAKEGNVLAERRPWWAFLALEVD